ncbi:response regulator transcription factor [bacterium 210917-DFI.7.65]|nr:response regulator transcription factor [bacterium 210917-DFI.7.65]
MDEKKRVLIVDDEKNIVNILKFNLQKEGYDTLEAYDGEAGLQLALQENPDLILLDVMLPKMIGWDVCKKLRETGSSIPVIILTAREEEEDKVLGLEIGADDYITKPFSTRELMARVKANIRRSAMLLSSATAPGSGEQMIASGDLSINTDRYEVSKKGKLIELTQREYELLCFLASRPDKVFSRTSLMEQVWNYDYIGDARTVDVTVRRLREKIETDPANPVYILTRRGVGYFFSSQH